ncbi:hypothetical protein GCM10009104_34550 [Marinobacterium maritimum]|uniref:Lipoprotein n=1 Tax=Marinobacterium maritimum TaxID=500162 RepID=A0ABN1IAH7_9GAMM
MPHSSLQGILALALALALALTVSGCSLKPPPPDAATAVDGYCLRAGDNQSFDCSAPQLSVQDVRDPLAPESRFSDEELMDLLAEVKRWLARRQLTLQGETIPPELKPETNASPTPSDTAKAAGLPRPWALILNDFSPQSLQRSNYDQH